MRVVTVILLRVVVYFLGITQELGCVRPREDG